MDIRFLPFGFLSLFLLTACGEVVNIEPHFEEASSMSVYKGDAWRAESEASSIPCVLITEDSPHYKFAHDWMWEHKTGWELTAEPKTPRMVIVVGEARIFRTDKDRLVAYVPGDGYYVRIIGPIAADKIFRCD